MTTGTIDNKVKSVISNIRNLPTPPIVFNQIQKVINDPKASATAVAAILAEDPAMSVKVLKLTNSAFYGLAREVDSVKQAVVIVGMEAIKNLVLSASVLDMFKGRDVNPDFQDRYWRHSLATGFCCRILAKNFKARGFVDADAAFSAGLLHDVGKMIICCFLPDEYKKYIELRDNNQSDQDYLVEQQTLDFTHAEIGGFLALQWKLPEKLGTAITYHHNPAESGSNDPLVYIVHIANYLSKKTFYDNDEQYLIGSLDDGVLDFMQIDDEKLEQMCEELREEYLKAETFMQMAGLT